MQIYKQRLLETQQFLDCEALNLYINLVNSHLADPRIPGKTDKHHILPESLFSTRGLPENNTENTTIENTTNDVRDDNIVDGVMNGVEDTVDGVVNGVDDVINGTENTLDNTVNDQNNVNNNH